MSLLLIGCGYWGQNWAKALYKMGELSAICDARPDIQAELKKNFPGVAIYSEPGEALQHAGLQGAIIATPVFTHRELARECLLAGKSILVEKPLTLEPSEAQELVTLADGGGLVLAVGHLLLYHPALLKLKEMMQSGELGEILGVQCTRVNLGKIRNEENVWWSLAPHDLSVISMLLGEPLTAMSGSKLNLLRREGLEDAVYASFITPSGVEASVQVSWYSPHKRHETVVIGSRKIAIFEDTLPVGEKLQVLDYNLVRDAQGVQSVSKGEIHVVPYEQGPDDLLTLQAKGFLAAIRGQRESIPNDGKNGAQVVSLLSQVQTLLSHELPGRPVQLPV